MCHSANLSFAMGNAWLTFMLHDRGQDIFCSCFFKAFASSHVVNHLLILALIRYFSPNTSTICLLFTHYPGGQSTPLAHQRCKRLFLTCCHLPSPTLQCVMLLVPSWYSCFTWEAIRSGFRVWDWRNRGTKESCDKMFSKERPGWFLVSSPGNIYLMPSKEIG